MNTFKVILTALLILCFITGLFSSDEEIFKEYGKALKDKDYVKCLAIVEKAIKEEGESGKYYRMAFEALKKLKRYPEAIEVAVKGWELQRHKNPGYFLDIARVCLQMNDIDQAFDWVDKAIDHGFILYHMLQSYNYKQLHNHKRFDAAILRIKKKIGMGKPAKDFTIPLMDGTPFTLSKQKGKVILIDFWATWCYSCRRAFPHLKELYSQFKDRGFDIIAISVDSDRQTMDNYLKKNPLPWKLAYAENDWLNPTVRKYNVNFLASYWLIDRTGTLHHFGPPLGNKDALKKMLEKLLAE
jgi:peroxiredoxin